MDNGMTVWANRHQVCIRVDHPQAGGLRHGVQVVDMNAITKFSAVRESEIHSANFADGFVIAQAHFARDGVSAQGFLSNRGFALGQRGCHDTLVPRQIRRVGKT